MKQGRFIISFMLFLGVLAPVNAVERSLIDFTTYNENIGQVVERDQQLYEEAIAADPDLDIRNFGWPEATIEAGDWDLENWKVVLNPSASTEKNNRNSQIKNSPSQQYGNVLGIRLHFQPWENAFWAYIKTPYYFTTTYVDGTFVSEGEDGDNGLAIGMLANVGQIKNVRSWVYGLNYDYTMGVQVVNESGKLIEYSLGSTYYEGWRRLSWDNSSYSDNPNDWTLAKNPLYPFSYPYIRYEALGFYKPEGSRDPHFFGYVRNVTVDFDFAIVRDEADIDDEAIWGVLKKDAIDKKIVTAKILAEQMVERGKVLSLQAANQAAAQ